jgi:predicted ATP-binding protein involved in virulence
LAVRELLNGIIRDIVPGDVEAFAKVGPSFTIQVEMKSREAASLDGKRKSGELVPFDNLSQGMASIFNWVGVLVQRLVDVYPDSPRPHDEPAVVLIDEIDAHLHPEWQRKLVEVTKKYFPNVQIIASSHSPLIAGALRGNELCVLERDPETDHVRQLPSVTETYGMRSHDILTSAIFSLRTDRNPEVRRLIDHYFDLYEKADPTDDDKRQLAEAFDNLKKFRYAETAVAPPVVPTEVAQEGPSAAGDEKLRRYFDAAAERAAGT